MFPDLRNDIGEYNLVITDRKDGIRYENKTQIVIIWLLHFKCGTDILGVRQARQQQALWAERNRLQMIMTVVYGINKDI